jgi:hypothetical protein
MLRVLGGLAEFERELIRSRTDEGRKRAKARGVKFGRKLKLIAYQRQQALARRVHGEPLALIDVAEREVYAALDWLIEQQTRIEAALAKKHLIDGTLVLYDVSSFLEATGNENPTRPRGRGRGPA